MDDNKKLLYPLLFQSVDESTSWGEDSCLVADLGERDTVVWGGWLDGNTLSEVMETYMERVVGDDMFAYYGRQFPLMVRKIKTTSNFPVTVSPDDETASQRYDSLGKAKLWYILSADPGARLYLGLKRSLNASEFYSECADGTIEDDMNEVEVKKGDYHMIAPGVLHAASGGLTILEIAESSEIDMAVSDRNRKGEAPLAGAEECLDFVRLEKGLPEPARPEADGEVPEKLVDTRWFSVSRLALSDAVKVFKEDIDNFLVYYCAEGEAALQTQTKDSPVPELFILKEGSAVVVPAETPDFYLLPRREGTLLIEAVASRRVEEDAYINPDASPTLPGDEDGRKNIFEN